MLAEAAATDRRFAGQNVGTIGGTSRTWIRVRSADGPAALDARIHGRPGRRARDSASLFFQVRYDGARSDEILTAIEVPAKQADRVWRREVPPGPRVAVVGGGSRLSGGWTCTSARVAIGGLPLPPSVAPTSNGR
jgi:CO/xanthine dehydrogenase FAD-binding subunit